LREQLGAHDRLGLAIGERPESAIAGPAALGAWDRRFRRASNSEGDKLLDLTTGDTKLLVKSSTPGPHFGPSVPAATRRAWFRWYIRSRNRPPASSPRCTCGLPCRWPQGV
jgi:hypothetical protein